jgi:hypothetical protein
VYELITFHKHSIISMPAFIRHPHIPFPLFLRRGHAPGVCLQCLCYSYKSIPYPNKVKFQTRAGYNC